MPEIYKVDNKSWTRGVYLTVIQGWFNQCISPFKPWPKWVYKTFKKKSCVILSSDTEAAYKKM